jgi:hypothetical protein
MSAVDDVIDDKQESSRARHMAGVVTVVEGDQNLRSMEVSGGRRPYHVRLPLGAHYYINDFARPFPNIN